MTRCAVAFIALGLAASVQSVAAGPRADYTLECSGCHLPDGSGQPPGVPDMRGMIGEFVQLPQGRRYLAGVPGASQSPLSDAELAAVLNWSVRAFASDTAPDDFRPYTAEEIAKVRATTVIERPMRMRSMLIEQLGDTVSTRGDTPAP